MGKRRHNTELSDPVGALPPWKVRELLDYDPLTGVLTWRKRPIRPGPDVSRDKGWNNRFAGKPAGCLTPYGYILVGITPTYGTEEKVLGHRLAWAHYYGEWPVGHVDHRNRIRDDNRIENLRLASIAQNLANSGRRKDNTSGAKGVSFHASYGKWRARLNVNGREIFCEYFDSKVAAIEARRKIARKVLGEFDPDHG